MINIDRESFVKLITKMDLIEPILDKFESGSITHTDSFAFVRYEEDVSIIYMPSLDKETPKIINWYKLYHIGRCLNVTGFEEYEDLVDLLSELKEELTEERRVI